MTDIFISYSRNDRERVRVMAQALEDDGFKVWWDPEILPGESFSKVIDKQLKESSCIIAVWSESSINSNWVQEEADDGMMRNTLIPVMIDEVDLPRGFKRLQTADLRDWGGNIADPNWQLILTQVRRLVSDRAAKEAAERQAAAQQAAVQQTRKEATNDAPPPPAIHARAPAPEQKRGGFPVLLVIGAMALIGAGVTGYLLWSRNDGEAPQGEVVVSNEQGIIAAPVAEMPNDNAANNPDAEEISDGAAPGEVAETQEAVAVEQGAEDLTSGDSVEETIAKFAEGDPSDQKAAEILTAVWEEKNAAEDEETAPPVEAMTFTPGEAFRDCDVCPEMMPFAAGATFTMGAPDGEVSRDEVETPQVEITIANPFAIGVYEITHDDWAACIADGGCGGYEPADLGWGKGRRPLINVSVEDAELYLTWLSEKTGAVYRLPSEAEWEYAARAGKAEPFHTGAMITSAQANFNGQYPYNNASKGQYRSKTTAVGAFAANDFGLHDMHGNVWEWTQDCWRSSHAGAPEDGSPVGGSCSSRVLKGGAWNAGAWRLRSAYRKAGENSLRKFDTGFRVVRDL
ncbi:MAG: hypothetical protein DHS20C05_03450 [Hyphococcus sp.]|nr:MAG: hypothetical protein DHS20C05_03450 [Marinicaulis sp.]